MANSASALRAPRSAISVGHQSTAVFFILFAIGVGLAAFIGYPDGLPSADAIARAGVGNDLVEGTMRGRQGLVGSLRWAPLSTLLAMPFDRLPGVTLGPFAMCIVAAGCYALLCAYLNSWWASLGMSSAVRIPILLAMYLSPWVRNEIMAGTSTSLFVLLAVLSACFFIDWWERQELRSLAYLSMIVGLGIISQYQFVVIFVGLLAGILVRILLRRFSRRAGPGSPEKRKAYAEGTLIIYVTPALYMAALWVLGNWLIMKDPGFFLRGLPWGDWRAQSWLPFLNDGCDWSACVVPAAVALSGWLGARVVIADNAGLRNAIPRRVLAGIGALTLAMVALRAPLAPRSEVMKDAKVVAVALEQCDTSDRVAVGGYSGYVISYVASPRVRVMLYHTLSIYMEQAMHDTRGRRLYVAVPPHTPDYRWEDVHLKYPRLYDFHYSFVVFERNIGSWRLLGVTRPD